eukprot:CAMPEP_0168598624 /NCGR_PEP_ID=MMETSP0420-20121227/11524_1 /TAXON_ID=498008 /ORGANISM="Pessonella sp." /LENGTH=798 /DNA_ID=CAMNT_0008636009 /DNA_START=99 /DNA_END=2495 /DNA_ORIENTATION=-
MNAQPNRTATNSNNSTSTTATTTHADLLSTTPPTHTQLTAFTSPLACHETLPDDAEIESVDEMAHSADSATHTSLAMHDDIVSPQRPLLALFDQMSFSPNHARNRATFGLHSPKSQASPLDDYSQSAPSTLREFVLNEHATSDAFVSHADERVVETRSAAVPRPGTPPSDAELAQMLAVNEHGAWFDGSFSSTSSVSSRTSTSRTSTSLFADEQLKLFDTLPSSNDAATVSVGNTSTANHSRNSVSKRRTPTLSTNAAELRRVKRCRSCPLDEFEPVVDRRQSFTTRVFSQPPSPLPSDELLTVPVHNSRRWSSARTSTDSPQHNHHGRPLRVAARLPRAVSSPSVNSSRHHSAGPRIDSPGTPSSSSSAYQRRRRRRANQALFSGSSRDSPTAVSSSEESVGTSSGSARRRARRAQQQQQQQQHQHQLLLQQKLQQQQLQQQQYARTLRSSNPNQSESPSASPADTTLLKSLSSSAPSLSVCRSSSLNAAAQPQYRRRSARPAAAAAAAAASSSSSSSATSSHRPVWPGSTSSTSIVRRFSDDHAFIDVTDVPLRSSTNSITVDRSKGVATLTVDDVAQLLCGDYTPFHDTHIPFTIIDCRFPYEYNGGHLRGAVNLYTKQMIKQFLFDKLPPVNDIHRSEPHALIFHCEFSSHRGPMMLKHARSLDRARHGRAYPRLTYPDLYLLSGGYAAMCDRFAPEAGREGRLAEHADLSNTAPAQCEVAPPLASLLDASSSDAPSLPLERLFEPMPPCYVPMNHVAYRAERRSYMAALRRASLRRTQSCGNLLQSPFINDSK